MLKILRAEPEFRTLWAGQAISQIGDSLYMLVFLYVVDKITGNPAMVGYVGAIQALPFLFLSPIAGAIADRVDRRKLMLWSDLFSFAVLALLVAALILSGRTQLWLIFVSAFLLSTSAVIFMPAKSAAIPRLVKSENLPAANSLSMATQNTMLLVGLSFSATALAAIQAKFPDQFFQAAIVVNGLTFAASALFIRKLPPIVPNREEEEEHHPVKESLDGMRYAWARPVLRATLFMIFGLQVFISPFMVVHITVNKLWFDGRYATLASFEIGFLAAVAAASIMVAKFKSARPGLSFALVIFTLGFFVALMGWTPVYLPYLALNFACGLVIPFADLPMMTYRQRVVEDAFQGRVQSLYGMIGYVAQPVSMAFAGMILASIGPTAMYALMGGGMMVVALAGLVYGPLRTCLMPEPKSA
jgi:MFS family permease